MITTNLSARLRSIRESRDELMDELRRLDVREAEVCEEMEFVSCCPCGSREINHLDSQNSRCDYSWCEGCGRVLVEHEEGFSWRDPLNLKDIAFLQDCGVPKSIIGNEGTLEPRS